jgi:putative membrane protein
VQDDGMYIRRGVLSHYLWMIPTEKFHVFYDTASLFQQRLHLKTLFVDTAGAAAFAYPEVIDLPEDEADEQLLDLHARFRQMYHDRIEAATGSATTRLSEDERPQLPDEVG